MPLDGYSPQLLELLELPRKDRRARIHKLSKRDQMDLLYCWEFWAREEQLWRPGEEIFTIYMAGRGWGKTRVGAEACKYVAENPELCGGRKREGPDDIDHGRGGWIGIAGATADEIRETMLFGESGLMTISDPRFMPRYYPSKRRIVWPNGVVGRLISGDAPTQGRGPNLGWLWADELPHWAKPEETWNNIELSHRHGKYPRGVITTTPLGIQMLIELCFECDEDKQPIKAPNEFGYQPHPDVRLVAGTTYDNAAHLAKPYITKRVARFEGTKLADQELRGKILLGVPGAMFKQDWFRRCNEADVPELAAIVIPIDPAVSEGDASAETGIVPVGLGIDERIYLLNDYTGAHSPNAWATIALKQYRDLDADVICGELNQGGNLILANLKAVNTGRRFKFEGLTASKSKKERWGAVAGYWEQGRVVHVGPARRWVKVEHQLTHFDPSKPEKGQLLDAADSAVWGVIACLGGRSDRQKLKALGNVEAWRTIQKKLGERAKRR